MRILSFLQLRATFLGLWVLSSVSLCHCGSTSSAALDAETKKPYQLVVVLHVADNRLLTDAFRDRLEREVHDGLQAGLGNLGEVKVVRQHPKLAEVLEKGLRSLDGWKNENERTPVKTHFVLIDFSGVHYELQARQYDSLTGMATPVIRHEKTQDRDFVARTAVLMVERDFGITGSFQTWPKGDKGVKVQLDLKGGGLDAPMNRWVEKGDVFAVVVMPTGNGLGRVMMDTIVQIETPPAEHETTCTGKLFWRREPPRGAGVAGFRCVKLGATKGPLQMRLVQVKADGSPGDLLLAPTLFVRQKGFDGEDGSLLHLNTRDKANAYDSTRAGTSGQFDRVAFVTVRQGDATRAEIPIVILDDQQVVVQISLTEKDAEPAEFQRRAWLRKVFESYDVQAKIFRDLQDKDTPREKLIDKAKDCMTRSKDDLRVLAEERQELYGDGQAQTDIDKRQLAQADVRLKAIREGVSALQSYVGRQEVIEKEEKDPKKQNWQEQLERGKLLERDAELGKAISLYDALLKDGYVDDNLDKHLADLRNDWKPKNEKHREARDFIYNVWPTLDTATLKMSIPLAQKALAECRQAEDRVGPLKLYKGLQIHAARLLKESDALNKMNEEDAKQLLAIGEIGADLSKLEAEIRAYLEPMK